RRAAALAAAGVASTGRPGPPGRWLSLAGLAVIAVAAAGPAASVPVTRSAGTVIVALDVSNSMAATDVAPTRLAAAQQAAKAFVDAQPDSVDIGVVAFENGALTTNRPSADHEAAKAAVDRLKVSGGTSLAAAVLTSLSAITGGKVAVGRDGTVPDLGYWPSATIVVFSDGEDRGRRDAVEAAATAAQGAGVHVQTVGVGTAAGTTVEVDGYRVRTALDEQTLTALARTTGGSYHPAADAAELDRIAATIDLRLTTEPEDLPLAGAFTALAVLLLAAGGVRTVLRTGRLV
ncbi:MAG TPA: VWA domain-containing protein, partial [Mycobacteriales bacterium]|nr:VWA domain-containing protein [Mycobacteriales bacterium]